MVNRVNDVIFIGSTDTRDFPDFGKDFVGGCLQDVVDIKYEDIVKVFGEPNSKHIDGYKTDAEWDIETIFGRGTIYNYKTGKNYLGEKGKEVEEITDWHIGGKDNKIAQEIIKELFKERECEYCGGDGYTLSDTCDHNGEHKQIEVGCPCKLKDEEEFDNQDEY